MQLLIIPYKMKNKLLTVKEYAEVEKVETSAIYNRISRKTLQSVFKHGVTWVFIDTDKTIKKPRTKLF